MFLSIDFVKKESFILDELVLFCILYLKQILELTKLNSAKINGNVKIQ